MAGRDFCGLFTKDLMKHNLVPVYRSPPTRLAQAPILGFARGSTTVASFSIPLPVLYLYTRLKTRSILHNRKI